MSKLQATVTNTLTTITNHTWGSPQGLPLNLFLKGIPNDYHQH